VTSHVTFDEYAARFLRYQSLADVRSAATLTEGDTAYPLLEARTPGRRTLLITAGFHGDEKAGPLTLLERFPEIVGYARERDVGLHVYPCINPSGFVDHTRYNRSGESPNNDFMRYELQPGVIAEELLRGQSFVGWHEPEGGPRETRALRGLLRTLPTPAAALDIHQDPWLEGHFSYAYIFGPVDPFLPFVRATEPVLPLARSLNVDEDVHTDEHGLIVHHDGSITDLMYRRGVPYTAALETTTAAPLDRCHEVNLIWIRGFIDLAASVR
jgi:hypothetical protein